MSVNSIRRNFRFSTGTLLSEAQRLLGALNDAMIGPPVVGNLSATFVADFTAQLALVAKLGNDQSSAVGSISALTRSQEAARADLVHFASVARRAAKLAFAGQGPLLRSEFQVSTHGPRDLPSRLERGGKLLAACRKYAVELAPRGWSTLNTDRLEAVLATLTEADQTQEAAKDGKAGITARAIAAASQLYGQCRAVQIAARFVYANAEATADAATVEARARFLLGEFPPRSRSTAAAVPPVTPALVSAEPAAKVAA